MNVFVAVHVADALIPLPSFSGVFATLEAAKSSHESHRQDVTWVSVRPRVWETQHGRSQYRIFETPVNE
jgi:hypothetical protein